MQLRRLRMLLLWRVLTTLLSTMHLGCRSPVLDAVVLCIDLLITV